MLTLIGFIGGAIVTIGTLWWINELETRAKLKDLNEIKKKYEKH